MSNSEDKIKRVVELLIEGKSIAEIFLHRDVSGISLERIKEIESIVRNENPIMKFEDTGSPSVLSYDVPNSTTYRGLNFIVLSHSRLDDNDWFNPNLIKE